MRSSHLHRWLLFVGTLSIAMLCATSQKANASCGDYVQILPNNAAPNSETPTVPHTPCHGNSCQKSPVLPVPMPVPTTATPVQSSDAILSVSIEVEAVQVDTRRDGDHASSCRGHLDTIFHPPR